MGGLTIGKLAKASGLRNDTLRFYERLGLIESEGRAVNGYRVFHPDTLKQLQFILRAKQLNFTLEEIRELLVIKGSSKTNCEDIYQRLQKKIEEVESKIAELNIFKRDLQKIAKNCPRSVHPLEDCSLMDFLDKPSSRHGEHPAKPVKREKTK